MKTYKEILNEVKKSHINNYDKWKSACLNEFKKRKLSGSIRYSKNKIKDEYAYINDTAEFVGIWYTGNKYGEINEL